MEWQSEDLQNIQIMVWECRQFHPARISFLLVDEWVFGPGILVLMMMFASNTFLNFAVSKIT
jgi:hypothetical protein